MRTPAEIRFRLRQEAANLYLLFARPQLKSSVPGKLALPDPRKATAAVHGSVFEITVLAAAKSILAHKFPLLGTTLETGPQIEWRRDYAHNKTSEPKFFRRIPYLNFDAVGDHKFIWELNRHQHLVLLAQAHLLTGQAEYLAEVFAQLESWLEQNPFQCGINWTSALEVAFRALSWVWLWHFCGEAMPEPLRARFLTSLYQHGLHLFENLSVYFSPNTHLLGEAVALHALGTLFPAMPNAPAWQTRGGGIVEKQLAFQVKADGSHFEQSSYYHVYALDFFVLHYLLAGRPQTMEGDLMKMAEYLHWLLGPSRRIAFFGDDDGGRLFHPQGNRSEFGRASIAACGILFRRQEWLGTRDDLAEQAVWWLGADALSHAREARGVPRGSNLFADAGAVFLQSPDLYVQFDAGPFGWSGAGHSHADALSLVAWRGGQPLFTDPGTFTYIGDPVERARFRGTPTHNTVAIDGLDQAKGEGPFRWSEKPEVRLNAFLPADRGGILDATCAYRGFAHRRRVLLQDDRLVVLDEVSGRSGEHLLEQRWNLGAAADAARLSFSEPAEQVAAEHSVAYGVKSKGSAMVCRKRAELPAAMAMCLSSGASAPITVSEATRMFDNENVHPNGNKKEYS